MGLKATVVTLLAFSSLFIGCRTATSLVKVGLRSSWPAPPLLVELLESVTLDSPEAFFPFLDALANSEMLTSQTLTPEAIYNSTLQIAVSKGFLFEPGSLETVELNVALHTATPKIEAFYQHYLDSHDEAVSRGDDCGSWIDWYGETVCNIEGLIRLAGRESIEPADNTSTLHLSFPRPKVLTFDHIYPPPSRTLERPPRTAIFYADLASANFLGLHSHLFSLADRPLPDIEYIFRHVPPVLRNDSERNYLSGYGVSLDLKKMEYLSLDDRHGRRQESTEQVSREDGADSPETDPIIPLLKTYPENSTVPDPNSPLTESELLEIGLQATQLILDSQEPLETLTHLSQNFPKYATAIARRVVVNDDLTKEIMGNHIKAQPGINMLWLNGATVPEKDINPFSLLRLLRKERRLMLSLTSLGLTRREAVEVITHPAIAEAQSENNFLDGIFDASDRSEEGGVVVWWNDIEKDTRYSQWGASIHGVLQPLYPGQFPSIRFNLFNTILVLDLSQTSSLNFIAGAVANIIERNFAIRFGLVPITGTVDSTQMARLFYYIIRHYGPVKTMGFFKLISQVQEPIHLQTPRVKWGLVRSVFNELVSREMQPTTDFDSVIHGTTDDSGVNLDKVCSYAERLGVTSASSQAGHAFVNGKYFDIDDNFLRNMQIEIGKQLQYFQQKVYEGELDDHTENISTYFYDLPTTSSRRNQYIYPTSTNGGLRVVNLIDLFSRTGFHISPSSFVYPHQSEKIPLTLFVVADLDSDSGLDLVKEALSWINVSSQTRVSFIHNPIPSSNTSFNNERPSWLVSHLFTANILSKASPTQMMRAIGLDFPLKAGDDDDQTVLLHSEILEALSGRVTFSDLDVAAHAKYVMSCRLIIRELHLAPGERALIANGRVVGPLSNGKFTFADFGTLEAYEIRTRAEPVVQALESVAAPDHDKASFAHLVSMLSSVISSIQLPDPSESGLFDTPPKPRHRNYQLLSGNHTAFEFGNRSDALYYIVVLLDPLSEAAQRWPGLVKWLSSLPDVHTKFYINPPRYSEVPLKRFYRYNLLPSLSFGEDGREVPAQAIFRGLPIEPIYTLAMDVPPSWLVRPREALYDLDNIQLGGISPEDTSVEAVFDLDYLIIEGHARDTHTNAPPRGLQLQLMNSNFVPMDDTQVVANLGYLQFKSKPGVFQLDIRPGRGRDIFKMESVGNEGWDSPTVEAVGSEITLTSFEGLTLYPRLSRLPGMETADVLVELDEVKTQSKGFLKDIMSRITLFFNGEKGGSSGLVLQSNGQADINIFTVASGLLYERFVSIMILSVLRNTNSTVKFWFIENFLSPSFLEFIPHLAEAYGFQYELVTYKWPSWLRAQKEKQRIIWAYKILFLDVLFPMDLKKVIFVDADQIVRADLKELVDVDLQGAAYGYTPMGDDNTDMEGFRFWKTGYWKDFLRGRPYHISALYVIDLLRFRQDILRGQYQALSQDPNSLANLDQDLPNNLQREVPIFSLHEDWLWCETWCSKDRLHRAKTIDLCQNPLTKEPKLSRARQIPEWEEYDREISQFARKLAEEGILRSRFASADANVLAGAGAGVTTEPDVAEAVQTDLETQDEKVLVHERDEL